MTLTKSYIDFPIDPTIDIFAEISKLKKQKNAVILAHYYQDPDIQDIADFVGDSLALSVEAEKTSADIIVFAGVHFMAETAKILNPDKKVLIPDLNAGCSLADSCPPNEFAKFKNNHPDHIVISYINCTAQIKALTDIICTSSNALNIVESIPEKKKLIYAPDKNLGKYISKKTGRNLLLWNGSCMVHEIFSLSKIQILKQENPNAEIIAHPECEEHILNIANYIGSTTALLNYTKISSSNEFIVVTESGILHAMQQNSPFKKFISAPPENSCACNDCPYMKLNTLDKIYNTIKYELPELIMPKELILKARKPLLKMLEISKS